MLPEAAARIAWAERRMGKLSPEHQAKVATMTRRERRAKLSEARRSVNKKIRGKGR